MAAFCNNRESHTEKNIVFDLLFENIFILSKNLESTFNLPQKCIDSLSNEHKNIISSMDFCYRKPWDEKIDIIANVTLDDFCSQGYKQYIKLLEKQKIVQEEEKFLQENIKEKLLF